MLKKAKMGLGTLYKISLFWKWDLEHVLACFPKWMYFCLYNKWYKSMDSWWGVSFMSDKMDVTKFITFDPSGDEKESILILSSDVTRVEPAITVDSLPGLLFVVKVAHKHMTPTQTDLSQNTLPSSCD